MESEYTKVSQSILGNLNLVNSVLDDCKIDTNCLTTTKQNMEKLKGILDSETENVVNREDGFLLDSTSRVRKSIKETMKFFNKIRELPKEFVHKERITKKTSAVKALPNITVKMRAMSLQNINDHASISRTISVPESLDTREKIPVSVDELIDKICKNKRQLDIINLQKLEYPNVTHFGAERRRLVKQFEKTLIELNENCGNLETEIQRVKTTTESNNIVVINLAKMNVLLQKLSKVSITSNENIVMAIVLSFFSAC